MNIKGYGIINKPIKDLEGTNTYKELLSLGIDKENIEIDILERKSSRRPNLERLIEELTPNDRIDIYSADVFLNKEKNIAIDYYVAILNKGVQLLIYDFEGACAKISPLSNVKVGNTLKGEPYLVRSELSIKELISKFEDYLYNKEKRLRTKKHFEFSEEFKDIYFAYESYQIDYTTTMQLLEEFCGFKNNIDFYLMSKEYEQSLEYENDLLEYANNEMPDILETPKRCNKKVIEYYEVLSELNDNIKDRKEKINTAMLGLGYLVGYDVFHRWELAHTLPIKIKSTTQGNFNLNEFYSKHTKRKDYR